MIVTKIAILFFFVLRCLSTNKKNKQIIILNDEIATIKNPIHCINDIYFLFKKELYRTCIQHIIKLRTEILVLVQKRVDDSWKTQKELFKDEIWLDLPSVFSFVLEDEIIIIICRYVHKAKRTGTTCKRWNSNTGTIYQQGEVKIDNEAFAYKNMDSYSSVPLVISNKKFLQICGILSYAYKSVDENNFISCFASEDKGRTWRTRILINYEQVQKEESSFYLRPIVLDNEFGFYFYSRISNSKKIRGGNYMTCTREDRNGRNNEYKFKCKDVDLFKKDKALQNLTKLNGKYITSYVKQENFDECYVYYTEHNAIVMKPQVHKSRPCGCYRGSFVKVDEEKTLFVYSTGYGVHNIHTLHYISYD
ncbi:hypothetical protein C922_04489 [Plasmodium inui San Antonio 1]|uniref:Cysteine-rich protective antigen 6 bladed domain-containing protein n=1 Tax=Plasmodium inui San Antonio 1 TaxID=1237626 RepID=W7A7L5_9APIC|nr:hypothetical protein C922_04489 [Plasmodium inui San Antonio 1]EUD65089.1 hypothetical protein C922_04489 [Plasmodium inui San Antonio 1]